jgi:hypothetical protein
MDILRKMFGKKQKIAVSGNQPSDKVQLPTSPARIANPNEHYMIKCRECDFTYHIPRDVADNTVAFSVDVGEVKMTCVYGRLFTVSLEVKEFFSITPVTESGLVLHVSIGDNMKPLHNHMLSHCDPLFLIIQQSNNQTMHKYRKQPEGNTYVKFSRTRGIDIVGNINVSKAEIPGVS